MTPESKIADHETTLDKTAFLANIDESLISFLLEVYECPLRHFSEKSLQVQLAQHILRKSDIFTPKETGITNRKKKDLDRIVKEEKSRPCIQDVHKSITKTIPLQMEYGNNIKGPYRLDIAIFNPDDIHTITNFNLKKDTKYLKPLVGIELGTEKSTIEKLANTHLENDLKKIKECSYGY